MPILIAPEPPDSADASALIAELDASLGELYPVESRHGFSVEKLLRQGVLFYVARIDGQPVGCGGLLIVGTEFGEVKRMYVRPGVRGGGVGKALLNHLEQIAREHGLPRLRLETGIHQEAAIRLYEREGFTRIPPFPPYFDDPVSLCYEKLLD